MKFHLTKKHLIITILAIMFLYIFVSFLSFDIKDCGDHFPQNTKYRNLGGKLGAIIIHVLYKWMGITAYTLPLALIIIIIILIKNIKISFVNSIWLIPLLIWFCVFFRFLEGKDFESFFMPSYGGLIGIYFFNYLKSYTGKATGLLLFITFVIIIMMLKIDSLIKHFLEEKIYKDKKF